MQLFVITNLENNNALIQVCRDRMNVREFMTNRERAYTTTRAVDTSANERVYTVLHNENDNILEKYLVTETQLRF